MENSNLCLIREDKRDITQFFCEALLFQQPKLPTVAEESVPVMLERRNSFNSKD